MMIGAAFQRQRAQSTAAWLSLPPLLLPMITLGRGGQRRWAERGVLWQLAQWRRRKVGHSVLLPEWASEPWARSLARKAREPKPKGDRLRSLAFPLLIDSGLPVLGPEDEPPRADGRAADRRHLRPGQDEALQGGLDAAIPWRAWAQ